jgi:hypothetical protein
VGDGSRCDRTASVDNERTLLMIAISSLTRWETGDGAEVSRSARYDTSPVSPRSEVSQATVLIKPNLVIQLISYAPERRSCE